MDMNGSFSRYAVIARPDPTSTETKARLRAILAGKGLTEDILNPDGIIVIGGDGTFLRAVHQYMDKLQDILFIGIHSGTLGFFMDYRDSDLTDFTADILNSDLPVEEYPILEAHVDKEIYYAVNEIRVDNPLRTQNITVMVNGEMFEEYRGSGLCLSTQLGSTAYNRSLGGAVLQKGLHAFELTEIAGIHHSRSRSLGAAFVMSDDTRVTFLSEHFEGAVLGADSATRVMTGEKAVSVFKSETKRLRILRGKKVSDFERLRRLF